MRELQTLTGDESGAQRVAWTETWNTARAWLDGLLDGLPLERERDAAGNDWWTLRGESQRAVLIGGHIDSVPNGGWLDGCLNVVAGAEVLSRLAEAGAPPVTVRLVNWADEEGARFGRSLFGSSAAAGSMADQDELRQLHDGEGVSLPDALAANGVDLDRALEARAQLETRRRVSRAPHRAGSRARVARVPLGAVLGTFGVERWRITWTGQAAHAGSTPMASAATPLPAQPSSRSRSATSRRRSATARSAPPVASSAARDRDVCRRDRGAAPRPAPPGRREPCRAVRAGAGGERTLRRRGAHRRLWDRIWSIEPILFDPDLIDLCDDACRAVAGTSHRLPSGPLHDAAEVARAGVPTVMLFVQSLRGLSHTKLEDTRDEHLELAVAALDRLADATIARVTGGS